SVVSLDYEAYEPMATKVLARIVTTLETEHKGVRLAITHRTGLLPVGEQSVIIAAASPHRDAAYAACRDALEEIKKDLPIWKRETTTDGEEWVGWGGG
ncbi:MAG: molybdenum cofactor biosynthesis protein MoaE, partial [Myxococcota bacterium]